MTIRFPSIQPTGHEFAASDWPTTEARSQSGVRSVRLWGDQASDAVMTLEFANRTQLEARQIWAAHKAAKGRVEDVSFPEIVFKNITNDRLLAFLSESDSGLRWYWASVPQGNRVQGGRLVTMRCDFRAELRL